MYIYIVANSVTFFFWGKTSVRLQLKNNSNKKNIMLWAVDPMMGSRSECDDEQTGESETSHGKKYSSHTSHQTHALQAYAYLFVQCFFSLFNFIKNLFYFFDFNNSL